MKPLRVIACFSPLILMVGLFLFSCLVPCTHYARGYDFTRLTKINVGMSEQEVLNSIGKPLLVKEMRHWNDKTAKMEYIIGWNTYYSEPVLPGALYWKVNVQYDAQKRLRQIRVYTDDYERFKYELTRAGRKWGDA